MPEDKKVEDKPKKSMRPKIVEIEEEEIKETPTEEVKTVTEKTEPFASFSTLDSKTEDKLPLVIGEEKDLEKADMDSSSEEVKTEDMKAEEVVSEPVSSVDNKQVEASSWMKDVKTESTQELTKEKASNTKLIIAILVLLLGVVVVAGGAYYYKTKVSGDSQTPVEEVTPTPVVTEPTATPTPTVVEEKVDYTKLKLNILNGTGVPGDAGKMATKVDSLDFAKVDSGNAKTYDYKTTEVLLKKGLSTSVYEDINKLISSSYTVKMSSETLPETSTYDVQIIVGSQK